jgi:hypothetical protein
MDELRLDPTLPTTDAVDRFVLRVAELLGLTKCWLYQRRYHFSVGYGWTLAISPESAGRFRIEACRWTRPGVTVWVTEGDDDRLAGSIVGLLEDIEERGGELWLQQQQRRTLSVETSG